MWMTGGPGCSSNLALLSELGPCLMSEASGELYRNAYGWNDEAFLLFVDQPTGVGFSYGDDVNYADDVNYVHNESEVAEDMYNFLQSFARKFPSPSITGANDFYVIGESYGGHYVPAVAHRVLIGNQRGDGPVINLKGIGIGNGWTDPYTQYPSYAEFAYHWCKEKLGAPCVAEAAYEKMLSLLPSCLEGIKQCNAWPTDQNEACVRIPPSCGEINDLFAATGRNWYDIRRDCKGPLCYSFEQVIRFYRDADVRASLGVHGDLKWAVCSDEVAWLFERDFYRNFNYTFPPLLAAGIRVLIYAGDTDYICNWIGNKAWTRALNWPGKAAFNAAQDLQFALNGRWAGEERAYGNLSFVRIYDAGHMVPMDQPAVSL
ncbi:serine carboxypeptidase (CBP1) putativeserine peptidase Clan SC Family S10, partial [Leptomonas seymouri]